MLRTIREIIQRPDGKWKVRLKCGHISNVVLKDKPEINRIYNCDRCEIKGQGVKHIVGHLNNGSHRKGHD